MLLSWLRVLYTVWCGLLFASLFLVFFPFIFLALQIRGGARYAHNAVRRMGQLFFIGIAMPIRVDWRFRPDPKQAYVYCANHFSYIDIAVTGVMVPGFYAYIGKIGVRKIPFFGYMFARLHIMVDRSSSQSRAYSLAKCIRTLAQGRSIVIFPEGGIKIGDVPAGNVPRMAYPFKDGAFTMAIQQQVPIVPLTLLNNYRILPDTKPLRVRWQPVRVVVHEPIPTAGLTQADVNALREQAYQVIDTELNRQISHESHPRHAA